MSTGGVKKKVTITTEKSKMTTYKDQEGRVMRVGLDRLLLRGQRIRKQPAHKEETYAFISTRPKRAAVFLGGGRGERCKGGGGKKTAFVGARFVVSFVAPVQSVFSG